MIPAAPARTRKEQAPVARRARTRTRSPSDVRDRHPRGKTRRPAFTSVDTRPDSTTSTRTDNPVFSSRTTLFLSVATSTRRSVTGSRDFRRGASPPKGRGTDFGSGVFEAGSKGRRGVEVRAAGWRAELAADVAHLDPGRVIVDRLALGAELRVTVAADIPDVGELLAQLLVGRAARESARGGRGPARRTGTYRSCPRPRSANACSRRRRAG